MSTTTEPFPRWTSAAWLHTAVTSQAAILIDYRTGSTAMLNGHTMQAWLACLAGEHPTGLDRSAVDSVAADFVRRGWLEPTSAPGRRPIVVRVSDAPASWGTLEKPAHARPPGPAPWRWRLVALPIVVLILACRQLGRRHRRFARLLWLTRLGSRRPSASRGQAQWAVRAVRWAARLVPARVACMEESVAAAVLLAVRGRHTRWCHGIATDPVRLHAWIADHDGPIEEPADTDQYTLITPALTAGPECECP